MGFLKYPPISRPSHEEADGADGEVEGGGV